MDAKYFAEIKARLKRGEYYVPYAPEDIKALLAEVERLTIENLGLKDAAIRCDGYEKRYHAVLAELDAKDQQIATLTKALELACKHISEHEECLYTQEIAHKGCCDWDGNCDESGCWNDYFIQQAQEQETAK